LHGSPFQTANERDYAAELDSRAAGVKVDKEIFARFSRRIAFIPVMGRDLFRRLDDFVSQDFTF